MTIGEKIERLRNNRHTSQRQLALFVGISHATISIMERAGADGPHPRFDTIKKIAAFFNVPLDLFNDECQDSGLDAMIESVNDNNIDVNLKHVPVYGGVNDAAWIDVSKANILCWYPVDRDAGKQSFGTIVNGDSMINRKDYSDSYPDGTVIIVDPEAEYIDGSYVLAFDKKNNQGLFRKIIIDGGRRLLVSNNRDYANIDITNYDNIDVVAKLICWFKGNKT